jgi:magnesium-transporting ATPase (P-type)
MRKPLATVWLALTLLPFGYFAYFVNYVMSAWGIDNQSNLQQQEAQFELMFRVHLVAMALICSLIASYIVYLFRTEHVPKDQKALWAIVLLVAGVFAMPVFWFIHVWKPLRVVRSSERSS